MAASPSKPPLHADKALKYNDLGKPFGSPAGFARPIAQTIEYLRPSAFICG
jgi:hypothetical protein